MKHALTTERRMIVVGWKNTPGSYMSGGGNFRSVHGNPTDRSIEFQRARIGEDVPDDWQPHITEVIVEERAVTEWTPVDD